MKYQGVQSKINPETERDAIVKFLNRYWDVSVGKGTLADAVNYILREGIKYGIALQEDKTEELFCMYNATVDMLRRSGFAEKADRLSFTRTSKPGPRDFDSLSGRVRAVLINGWQVSAQPKDYDAYCKQHANEDCPENEENLEFDGVALHTIIRAVCPNFPDSLRKSNVMYSDKNQGRPPLEEFIGSVLHQGMTIGMRCVEQKYGTLDQILERTRNITA